MGRAIWGHAFKHGGQLAQGTTDGNRTLRAALAAGFPHHLGSVASSPTIRAFAE